jgi:hypothetical protein
MRWTRALPSFHAPPVERINVPDHALSKYAVLAASWASWNKYLAGYSILRVVELETGRGGSKAFPARGVIGEAGRRR